ncbi:MAG: hypothetical protein ACRBBP_05660 [Bdellovibrionales bacterium]
MLKFAFVFFIFSSSASAFDPSVIEQRYTDAALKYNESEILSRNANCWGTLLNITGLTQGLSVSDYAPVLGFFQSKHCKQVVPNDNGDFFTHIDGSDGAYHSYYVGPDLNAWQKFDPSSYSLIKKESHEEILAW